MKLATIALISCFAGYLGAQTNPATTSTPTSQEQGLQGDVNLSGSLIDQGCYTTQHKTSDDKSNTTTEITRIETQCPVSESTTSFGVLTADGKFVRFDPAGNTRVMEMVKSNKDWQDFMSGHKPVKVHVIGTANGDMLVLKEIK
jgi:hypothetical protein